MKSSTPFSDLLSFGGGVMAKGVCVRFSWFISDGETSEEPGCGNE